MSRQKGESMPKRHHVFVYGTLRQGDVRGGALEGYRCVSRKAVLPEFRMHHLGGFPGIVAVEDETRTILGEIYEIDQKCLELLDRIEGHREEDPKSSFYRRTEVEVAFQEDEKLEYLDCWTYVFNNPERIKHTPIIESGDWMNR